MCDWVYADWLNSTAAIQMGHPWLAHSISTPPYFAIALFALAAAILLIAITRGAVRDVVALFLFASIVVEPLLALLAYSYSWIVKWPPDGPMLYFLGWETTLILFLVTSALWPVAWFLVRAFALMRADNAISIRS